MIDLLEWHTVSLEFQKVIEVEYEVIFPRRDEDNQGEYKNCTVQPDTQKNEIAMRWFIDSSIDLDILLLIQHLLPVDRVSQGTVL